MTTICESPAAERTGTRNEILRQLRDIRDLPTLPTIFMRILRILRNPDATVKAIAGTIEADQAISMKVLKLINSSFYGLSRKVDSVQQAIVLLGSTTLKNVVISASVFKALGGESKESQFNREAFWQHSIGCGLIARCLGNHVNCGRDEEGFIAGIIHDIGKVVLDQYFNDKLRQVVKQVRLREISFYQAETEILGTGHPEIGSFLAEQWKLPEKLVEVIAQHHDFAPMSQYASLIALIQISNMLAHKYKVGSGGDDLTPEIEPSVWQHLKLEPHMLDVWEEEILTEIAKGKELLDLMLS